MASRDLCSNYVSSSSVRNGQGVVNENINQQVVQNFESKVVGLNLESGWRAESRLSAPGESVQLKNAATQGNDIFDKREK
jgi:hypothetical protein